VFEHRINPNRSRGTWLELKQRANCAGRFLKRNRAVRFPQERQAGFLFSALVAKFVEKRYVIPSEGESFDVFEHRINPNRSRGTWLELAPGVSCVKRFVDP
jgi:hypothetical protein